jgi:protein arginine kinase activator
MRCERCGEREAAIHLTQIVDNAVTTTHLCEPCAAAQGVDTQPGAPVTPLFDFLASLGKGGAPEAPEAGADVPCPGCGATLRDFRQTGRLGCARCYETFAGPLRDLLRRLHGSATHAGEVYEPAEALTPAAGAPSPAQAARRLVELRDQLRRAIESENFELAAELRDRIRVLE